MRGRAQQQEHRLRLRLDRQGALTATPEAFVRDVLRNAANRAILERLPALGLPDAWLVAGCLFQTVWNLRSGLAPGANIRDYDLFYFDAGDLSQAAEAQVGAHVQTCFADLGVTVEAKNQARVHTWYPAYFGYPYPALGSSKDGIDRFLVRCTCVGISAGLHLYAPTGLDDLYAGRLQPNPLCDRPALFNKKAADYRSRWNWLTVEAAA